MKIRQGFVSNSSTTSFCIYGMKYDGPESNDEDEDESLYDKLKGTGLEHHRNPNGGSPYVGMSPWNMEDDETMAQFRKRVEKLITKKLGVSNPDCGIIEEAWYDG
jgi:hypothetical protein